MRDEGRPVIAPQFVLLLGILAVSTASIFIRFAQGYLPSLTIAFYRLLIASLILFPVVLIKNRHELANLGKKDGLLLCAAGVFLGLHFASWITSLEFTSIASSVVLVTTTPLWVGLLAGLFLKEKIQVPLWVGLLIALAGSMLVGMSQSEGDRGLLIFRSMILNSQETIGNLLALGGALMAAFYILIGRAVRPRISMLSYIFLIYGMGAITVLVMILLKGDVSLAIPRDGMAWVFLLAIVPQLIGHSSFNWALRYLPAAYVSVSLMGEPIGTMILAYFILKEIPEAFELAGAVMILIGIFIASSFRGRGQA